MFICIYISFIHIYNNIPLQIVCKLNYTYFGLMIMALVHAENKKLVKEHIRQNICRKHVTKAKVPCKFDKKRSFLFNT